MAINNSYYLNQMKELLKEDYTKLVASFDLPLYKALRLNPLKADKQLIAQVELPSKSIDAMTEELGTKPTVDEIANYMGVQQKTVLEILKLSGEELPEGEFYKENRLWIDNPEARKFSN